MTTDAVPNPNATADRPETVSLQTGSFAASVSTLSSDPGQTPPKHSRDILGHIGRYEIREQLGEGAFGIVFRAFDPQLSREVALKVAKPEQLSTPERRARFIREARSAANLRHPNIVQVFEASQDGETAFIAQGFIDGPSIDRVLKNQPGKRLPPVQTAAIIRKLAEALAYAHQRGIVHRDIKPANALLETSENGAIEPVLTDFGLAAFSEEGAERITQDGTKFMGTPAYMAPEQAHGNAEPASDQYSLGCTFYELLTGQTPFGGPPSVQIANHLSQPIPSPRRIVPSIPRDLETICLKCVEKEPSARYASCAELAEDLRRWQDGEPVLARRLGYVGRFVKWAKRNPGIAASLLMVMVALALGAGFATRYGIRAELARQSEEKVAGELKTALKDSENARNAEAKISGELKTTLSVSEQRRIDAVNARNAESKISGELKTTLGVSEQRAKDLKKSLRESKERLYLADERLYTARVQNAQTEWEHGNKALALVHLDSCRWDLRGWEYHYLQNQIEQSHFTLKGHTSAVTSVSFSPDGTRIVTGSDDNTAKVWDARTGELLPDAMVPNQLLKGPISPDGHLEAVIEGIAVRVIDRRPTALELRREEAERRREHLTRIARFDAFWHDRMARDAEKLNDHFAAEFHLRLLVEHAPDYLDRHERRAKVLQSLNRPLEAVAETKIAEGLKASPPELIEAPHLEPLPPPGPRAKIKFFNPLPPNFDD